jgi:hypothetical protein
MVKKERYPSQILRVLFLSLLLIAISSGFVFAQTVILNQVPNQVGEWGSDPGDQQSLADNFIVSSTAKVTQIRIWGAYGRTNTAPATDNFTVIFHADSAGLPGATISTQNNVPVVRQATGGTVVGFTEYVYTLTLATPVIFTPGTYWVEIYNETASVTDNFGWETGTVDPTNGIPNSAFSLTVPGSSWQPIGAAAPIDLAIEITKETVAVPTMNEWGMIIFAALAGMWAIYYSRRQRRTER